MNIVNTEKLAKKIRIDAVNMTHDGKASHIGSILSIVDIIAVLYGQIMKFDPNDPDKDNRDRLILSKGHAGVAIYAALAELGFIAREELKTYYKNNSNLSGHVSHKNVSGVEFSTGSLGHGVCVASGMALAAKYDNKEHRIFSIIGDGECNEGSVWEMAMFSSQFRLNNFTVIVDNNKFQAMGTCKEVIDTFNLSEKWRSFGWKVIEINGHRHDEIKSALLEKSEDEPTCVIAHTVKGKGISFMENNLVWHYKDPQDEFYEKALLELGDVDEELFYKKNI